MELLALILFLSGSLVYVALHKVPAALKILMVFLCFSVGMEITWLTNIFPESEKFSIQLVADIVFMSTILQEIFIGRFYWRLSFVSILLITILSYAFIGFTYSALSTDIPFDVASASTLCLLAYGLIFRIMNRVKRYICDYRFWISTGIAMYYLLAQIAFYLTWLNTDNLTYWWLHGVALSVSLVCFTASFISWHFYQDAPLEVSERFLLPNWLFKRLLYFFDDLPQEMPG